MLRLAMVLALLAGVAAGPAIAQQATFGVGVTIGKKVKPPKSATVATTYTWGAARISVARAGYTGIRRHAKGGGLYWFTARKGENLFQIAVSATTGAIAKVIPA